MEIFVEKIIECRVSRKLKENYPCFWAWLFDLGNKKMNGKPSGRTQALIKKVVRRSTMSDRSPTSNVESALRRKLIAI